MPDSKITQEWEVRVIDQDSAFFPAMLELRNAVLRRPLGLEISKEDLAAEQDQIHLVLINRKTESVEGSAMLIEKSDEWAKVRQVAISENLRGKGLGQFLMEGVEEAALLGDYSEIHLHARDSAVQFYKRAGYEIAGDSFIEVGLPHLLMRKKIG